MKNRGLHVGIIPDGSRRWGITNGKPPSWDGRESGEKAKEMIYHILENHPEITEITIWAMSTENFKRDYMDKKRVFDLVENLIDSMLEDKKSLKDRGIKVNFFGTKFDEVPQSLKDAIARSAEMNKEHGEIRLNIGLGYGGKFEIVMAAANLAKKIHERSLFKKMTQISERMFEKFLMVPRSLDLIIRTGGERRLSGFMLYQAEYAELFFSDTLWPDFSTKEFDGIMEEFRQRDRRFGK